MNLSKTGRIFYGVSIAGMGFQTVYEHDFPYMVLPPNHSAVPGIMVLAYIFGVLLVLAGGCIVFEKKIRPISLLLSGVFLLIFCFYYIPYEFLATSNYMHFGEWENAAKELTFAGGAFVIAGCYPQKNKNSLTGFLEKLIPLGVTLFAITIISFSIDHFLYAKEAAGYVPIWAPNPVLCLYITGAVLLSSGIAIALNIRRGLAATLLGTMIFMWFICLHIPRIVVSSAADMGGEVTSAFLALAYCGVAFVIAGAAKKKG